MTDSKPLVSIGMPVYNGERFLQHALDSLLAQTYENFELHISDNASTDRTEEICHLYGAADKRLRYHRNSSNIGILKNWHVALALTTGEYFMWAACDDRWSPNYIETLMECLLDRPKAVLSAGKTLFIDHKGICRDKDPDYAPPYHLNNNNVTTASQLLEQHAAGWLHGLYRSDGLFRTLPTLLTTHPWGGDIVFLLELCLNNEVVGSDAAIMYKRVTDFNNSHSTQPRTPREIVTWQSRYAFALLRVILKSHLSLKEKGDLFKTYAFYLKRLYWYEGLNPWAKTWIKAGYDWLIGVH